MLRPVLLYDADCGFCTRAASWLSRRGLAVRIRPLQDEDLAAIGVDTERAYRELPLVTPDGAVAYGHTAVAGALRTGGAGWRLLGRTIMLWPIRYLARAAYHLVSRYRQHLPGGTSRCDLDHGSDRGGDPGDHGSDHGSDHSSG